MTTISELLRRNVKKWPDRPALIASHRGRDVELSFAKLEAAALSFSVRLSRRGIRQGDAVLVFIPMSLELYVALLGIFRAGAVAVFLDPSSGLRHINACCRRVPPAALVGLWPLRGLRPFVGGLRRIPLVFSPPDWNEPFCGSEVPDHATPDRAALITFTSGSTGEPKAAVRSHRFLLAQYESLKTAIALEPGERDLTTLPVFVLANLAAGITSILPDGKISRPGSIGVSRMARQIQRLAPSRTGGSPAFYQRLLEEPASLRSFQKIYTGGAPVFPAFLQKLQRLAPAADVVAVYGSTEAEPIAHISCREISGQDWQDMREGRGLLTGRPVPEIDLRIIPDQWGQVARILAPQAQGLSGEILVSGPHVLKGYLDGRGDEETKVRSEDKIWHRTGDAGYLDAAGRLWLLGRCSARISGDGKVLYPFAVECVAMSFPFIRRAACVVVKMRRLLVLEVFSRPTDQEFSELKQALAWSAMDEVRTLQAIPVDRRHNAKVDYPRLMKMLR